MYGTVRSAGLKSGLMAHKNEAQIADIVARHALSRMA
jgi:hypothetical protein